MEKRGVWVGIVFFFLVLAAVSTGAATRTALVIGNSAYKTAVLKNPVNDAVDISNALKLYGFNVTRITDADRKTMRNAIREFGDRINKGGVGLFYYAGHGIQVRGENYMVPVSADVVSENEVEDECLRISSVLRKMESAGNGLNIIILDACRNNPFGRSFRSSESGLAKMDAPTGSIIAYSTAPGSVAADGSGRNGLYTSKLLNRLKIPGTKIEEVFKSVRKDVLDATKMTQTLQTPWESSSLTGDFYFVPGLPANVPISKPLPQVQPPPAQLQSVTSQANTPMDMDTLLAMVESEKAQQEKEKLEQEARLKKEKSRKAELKEMISKYELLIKTYGDKYKHQAWQAICMDFPMLTTGLKTGEVFELKQRLSLNKADDTWTDPVTGMEFVFVPAGCFQMGGDSGDAADDEKPVHEVCVDGFWMGRYEVTQGQWKKIMGSNPSRFQSGDNFPVEKVSWNDAKNYISKLTSRSSSNFSLPTEAQWEYAARSLGKDQIYTGGNNVDNVAWYDSNSGRKTHPVGTKSSNGLGIYDMSGNVWEWCEDVYDSNAYSKHSRNNPLVTSSGNSRVYRGGSWLSNPLSVSAANRDRDVADYRVSGIGFRLCISRTNQ